MRTCAVLGLAVAAACSKGDAAPEAVPPGGIGRASTVPLTPGEYTVRSAKRFTGATLSLVDNKAGAYSAQLQLANGAGLYSGIARPAGADSVEMALSCLCPVDRGGGGLNGYEETPYGGHYLVREIGGGRLELRQTDGPAVDTVARVRAFGR